MMNDEIFKKDIPYLNDRFHMLCQTFNKEDKKSTDCLNRQAATKVVLQGIKYYQDVLDSLKNMPAERIICESLVSDLNIAIYAIYSRETEDFSSKEEKSETDSMNNETDLMNNFEHRRQWLNAYREYLQCLFNSFYAESYKKNKSQTKFIYTLSFNLMQSETKMNFLFSQKHFFKNQNPHIALCSVYIPSDMNINDIFTYLPKLTHEVSHGFLYSDRKERNEFVLEYLLGALSKKIVRELFFQVSGNHYEMFIGTGEERLAVSIKSVLSETIQNTHPKLLTDAHLEEFLPAILEPFFPNSENIKELQGFFKEDANKYEITKLAFMNLAKKSTMDWYIMKDEKIADRKKKLSEEEMILSIVADIFIIEDMKEVNQKYGKLNFKNKRYSDIADRLLKDSKEPFVTLSALEIAFNVLMQDVTKKFAMELKARKNSKIDIERTGKLLSSIADDQENFIQNYKEYTSMINKKNQQELQQVVDEVLFLRINAENLIYIKKLPGEKIIRDRTDRAKLTKDIYHVLRNCIFKELESEKSVLFSDRDTHIILTKLGLLNHEDDTEQFIQNYKRIFKHWDKNKVSSFLEQTLNVYREIFADLSMCAIFHFSSIGYFRYITQQFRYTRSFVEGISRNQTRQRIRIVTQVLQKSNPKDALMEKKGEIFWNDSWNSLFDFIKNYPSDESEEQQHYFKVFDMHIKDQDWVKKFRENDIINAIGEFYNTSSMDEILQRSLGEQEMQKSEGEEKTKYEDARKKEAQLKKCFKEYYYRIAQKREEEQKKTNEDVLEAMLKDIEVEDIP